MQEHPLYKRYVCCLLLLCISAYFVYKTKWVNKMVYKPILSVCFGFTYHFVFCFHFICIVSMFGATSGDTDDVSRTYNLFKPRAVVFFFFFFFFFLFCLFFVIMAVPRLFLCSSSLFICRWFHIWRLFCHDLFLISPSFGAFGKLFYMIVAFPG